MNTPDAFPRQPQSDDRPGCYPIWIAPKVPDAVSPAILLSPRHGDGWLIAYWEGEDWFGEGGLRVDPIA